MLYSYVDRPWLSAPDWQEIFQILTKYAVLISILFLKFNLWCCSFEQEPSRYRWLDIYLWKDQRSQRVVAQGQGQVKCTEGSGWINESKNTLRCIGTLIFALPDKVIAASCALGIGDPRVYIYRNESMYDVCMYIHNINLQIAVDVYIRYRTIEILTTTVLLWLRITF